MDRPYLPSEVSCNLGRDWPDSRGIWQNNDRSLVAFLNRRDHIILSLINSGADFKSSFVKFFEFVSRFEESVRAQKWEIMRTKHLGNLTTDPKNLGTALKISVRIKLPKLSKDSRLQALLKSYNLSQSYRIVDELQHSEDDFDLLDEPGKKKESSILEISSIYTLGKSEVLFFNESIFIKIQQLIDYFSCFIRLK